MKFKRLKWNMWANWTNVEFTKNVYQFQYAYIALLNQSA